jgi:hypothetical protein
VSLLQGAALWPHGVGRSPYAAQLAWLLVGAALLAVLGARWVARGGTGGAPPSGAFAALLLAFWVEWGAVSHPCLVTSDAVFHAHKVKSAAEGDYFPLSLTPHHPPFRFPYGVSFHLLLAPLYHAGLDPARLVVLAAAAAGLAASGALLLALQPWGPGRAALAVALLQLMPVTFGPFSAGNFSNVFAQASTVLFLCWWLGPPRGGFVLGAGLLALAATAHFGGLVVLLVLCPVILLEQGRYRDPRRLRAVVVGLGLAALYYVQFLGVMTSQLPRLLEGSGAGPDLVSSAALQVRRLVLDWGWPAAGAALLGIATAGSRRVDSMQPFRGLWIAGTILALVAVATPLEVRYLYALAPAAAVLAADALQRMSARRGGRLLVAGLLLVQGGLAAAGIVRAVLFNYRSPG